MRRKWRKNYERRQREIKKERNKGRKGRRKE